MHLLHFRQLENIRYDCKSNTSYVFVSFMECGNRLQQNTLASFITMCSFGLTYKVLFRYYRVNGTYKGNTESKERRKGQKRKRRCLAVGGCLPDRYKNIGFHFKIQHHFQSYYKSSVHSSHTEIWTKARATLRDSQVKKKTKNKKGYLPECKFQSTKNVSLK
jgi:hypothetical protein